jgi:phosphoribosylformylglycinamidine synthase subunit PurL
VLVSAASKGWLASAHDVSTGGLGVALAVASIAGGRGATVDVPSGHVHRVLFDESPSRAVISCRPGATEKMLNLAARHGVPARVIGECGGGKLELGSDVVDLDTVSSSFETALPAALSATLA